MLIYVYGTLKRAHGNNRLLERGNAKYLGDAATMDNYFMGGYGVPMVFKNDAGKPVRGEVWDIGHVQRVGQPVHTLRKLDALESNGRVYQRALRKMRMLTGGVGEIVEAWIYEGMPRFANNAEEDLLWLNTEGHLEWHMPTVRQPKSIVLNACTWREANE